MRPLRGREAELAALKQLVESADRGESGVAVVEGPPGIGKSRLLQEAGRFAATRALTVAAGTTDELDQITPWGSLVAALSSGDPPLVGRQELMSLGGLVDGRLEVLERIRSALEHAAGEGPLLIVIDDLQWADPSTLLAVGSLTRQLFAYPIAWLFGRRPFPVSDRLSALLDRLAAQGVVRLSLGPLPPGATTEIATDLLGRRPVGDVERLVSLTEGNPLYLVEILRDPENWRVDDRSESSNARVTQSLSSAVVAHLRSLSEPAQSLVKVASVLGPTFSVVELSTITGRAASEMVAALEEAVAAGVLTEDDSEMAFRHDLFRQAVYDELPGSLRLALHRDAAAALLDGGAPASRIATHLAISAMPGDERAVEALGRAVVELFATSPTAAADLACRIVELVEPDDPRRPAFVAAAVQMLGWSGRLEEARALGEAYVADNDLPAALEAEIELGMRRAWGTRTGSSYPRPLRKRLITDEDVPPAVRAGLIAFDQNGAMMERSAAGAARSLERAWELVARDPDRTAAAVVQSIRVSAEQEQGHLLEALALARAPIAESETQTARATGIQDSTIASCLATLGQDREALAALERAYSSASSTGHPIIVSRVQSIRATVLLELGRVDDARAEAEAAAELAETLRFDYYLGQALVTLAESALRAGDVRQASAAADRLAARAAREPTGDAAWAAALCADATGHGDAARQALAPLVERLAEHRFMGVVWYPLRLPMIVALAVRSGDSGLGEAAAGAAAELDRRNPSVAWITASALHARGLITADASLLRRAAELFDQGERPLATAAAQEDLAAALAAANAKDEAIDRLEVAYETYVRAGAHRDTARVRAALRSLGVRKRRTTVARPERGWESLTKSEAVVVDLVARGMSSREAAGELFLSLDTVNTHLRHAFGKLGIRSRVQLARLAAEREREPA